MNSTTHPNEESNRVLKALFLEKKKVKALEQRLKEIGQKGHVDHPGPEALEDMRKMRQLFLLLKQKYAQALTTLKEYESKESESQALLQQINQLKSTQSNFQQKLTHLDEENEALRIQLKHAKKLLSENQEVALRNYEELKASQKHQLNEALEQAKSRFSFAEEENQTLRRQLTGLQMLFNDTQEEVLRKQGELRETNHKLHENNLLLEQLKQEMALLKSEVPLLKKHEEKSEEEIQFLKTQLINLQMLLSEAQEEVSQKQASFENLLEKNHEASALLEEFKKENAHLNNEVPRLRKQEQETAVLVNELNKSLENTQEQNARLKLHIEKFSVVLQEKEKRILELQQVEGTLKRNSEQKQALESALEQQKKAQQEVLVQKIELENALLESKRHAEQLERVIQFLRERSEEAHLQVKELQGEFQQSRQILSETNEKLESVTQQSSELKELLQKSDKEKQQAVEELSVIYGRVETLKSEVSNAQNLLEVRESLLQAANQEIDLLKDCKLKADAELEKRSSQAHHLEIELERAKQSVVQSSLEMKEMQDKHQQALENHQQTISQLDLLKNELETRSQELQALQKTISEMQTQENDYQVRLTQASQIQQDNEQLIEKNVSLQENLTTTTKKLDEASESVKQLDTELTHFKNLTVEKENLIEELQLQINDMRRSKEQLEQDLLSVHRICEEKDADVRMAQQHLAKKVKEAAFLSEKIEVHKIESIELQNSLNQNKTKIAELQTLLDKQNQQEKKMQEEFHERMKLAEIQLSKWEEKYFALQDKWQEADNQLRELKNIQEKYHQVQAFVANLGNLMGMPQTQVGMTPPHKNPPSPLPVLETPPLADLEVQETPEERRQKSYDLFEIPENGPRHKQSLFD